MSPDPVASATSAPDNYDTETLERLLTARHSCRGFGSNPVPRGVIERILTLAQRTASWCNAQPWQVSITQGQGTDRFNRALVDHVATDTVKPDIAFPREYRGVHLLRRRECGFQLYESVGIARGDRAASARQTLENFRFFGAPHVAIVTTEVELGVYGAIDCGAYVANFVLAAQSLGVATIAQAALAAHSAFIRDFFRCRPTARSCAESPSAMKTQIIRQIAFAQVAHLFRKWSPGLSIERRKSAAQSSVKYRNVRPVHVVLKETVRFSCLA